MHLALCRSAFHTYEQIRVVMWHYVISKIVFVFKQLVFQSWMGIYVYKMSLIFETGTSMCCHFEGSCKSTTEVNEWRTASHIMNDMIYNTVGLAVATMAHEMHTIWHILSRKLRGIRNHLSSRQWLTIFFIKFQFPCMFMHTNNWFFKHIIYIYIYIYIYIICLGSRFHAWNQCFFYSIITFSYTKYLVHSYTVDVVFTLSW